MKENRLTTFLLAVIAGALVIHVAGQLSWGTPALAQAPSQEMAPVVKTPAYRSVIIDRYENVAGAERGIQLRLLEGFEVISVQILNESIGELNAERPARLELQVTVPINSSWVVIYGRR